MTGAIHEQAEAFLLKYVRLGQRQENLCFALWRPSRGDQRFTAILSELVLPEPGEVLLNGNVSFQPEYLTRAIALAARNKSGIALLHCHFTSGWQGMSDHDVQAERVRLAPAVLAGTELPVLGMTIGTDGAWSARLWPRVAPREYEQKPCISVRVIGAGLSITWHPQLRPPPPYRDELRRTISVWGPNAQADVSRIHVGIVGLGSVGRLVAEALARMGVQRVTLIDFDRVERHNLDRLLGAYTEDAEARHLKVELAARDFKRASTSAEPVARAVVASIVEADGYFAALNCDVLFSCVDRPWARRVLNHIAYAHLVPVVDGGIIARMQGDRFRGAEWAVRTVGPGRACLACVGAYEPSLVDVERKGLLDDPSYLADLPDDHPLKRNENVFHFSMNVASLEIQQFAAMITGLLRMPDLGEQRYHYNLREIKAKYLACKPNCEFARTVATADSEYGANVVLGKDPTAARLTETLQASDCRARASEPQCAHGFWRSVWNFLVRKKGRSA